MKGWSHPVLTALCSPDTDQVRAPPHSHSGCFCCLHCALTLGLEGRAHEPSSFSMLASMLHTPPPSKALSMHLATGGLLVSSTAPGDPPRFPPQLHHIEGKNEGGVIKCWFLKGFPPWLSGKESTCKAGDAGSISGSGRSPGEGHGNPVFLPGEYHGQRSWAGYSSWGPKESDMTEVTEHPEGRGERTCRRMER